MSIQWQEELATGIDAIDKQHKGIFARFAAFSEACSDGDAKEEMVNLLLFLEDYTLNHFRDEEKALQEAKYPELSAQQKAHAIFAGNISELRAKVGEQEPNMPEILEMKRLLIRWLIQHIKHEDMAYTDFLKSRSK
ncbi:MAG TPA: bacteriohemerythrin [Geobacteraceae bacterium]|nr:bacteriohemerythrin [Geobacteraceae bacterium]